ncbi:MurR/RpiR family transcriptional regulator [Anaerotignum sp.]|uniref:MurR/RpiR family transcriptional regulator n=1 Tax=Anaerotignum sp. TaxID=2039241 RepID=UPI0028B0A4FA|nr:MurR/RpiR family transcriptional regulator [Anaerotignum sp.]
MEVSCAKKIQGKMRMFTQTEKKLADYVLANYEEILNKNIVELAESAEVSEASIVRFCKSLGYKGFQEFKINAARDVIPKEKHFNPSLDKDDDTWTICQKMFASGVSVLNRTLTILNADDLDTVSEFILKSKKIVFFGIGGSSFVCQDAQHKFMKIGLNVFVYPDVDMQMMAASLMTSEDLAIGVSHSGTNRSVLECLKTAKESGAKTVALVAQGKTPISKIADIVLYTGTEETVFKSESLSTRIAQLTIIDTLVSIVSFKDYNSAYQAIQLTRKATSSNKY